MRCVVAPRIPPSDVMYLLANARARKILHEAFRTEANPVTNLTDLGRMTLNEYMALGYLVEQIMIKTGRCTVEHESVGGPACQSGEGHRQDDRRSNGSILNAVEILATRLGIGLPKQVRVELPTVPDSHEIGSPEVEG